MTPYSSTNLAVAPILSTPDTYVVEDLTSVRSKFQQRLSDEQIRAVYEIDRTCAEIRENRWRRIALQFPDEMLPDAPRVYEELNKCLQTGARNREPEAVSLCSIEHVSKRVSISSEPLKEHRLYILADTSYGACCVDEVAAEHVDADGVVHYGQACLSPTARLPVIHVFTQQPLAMDPLIEAFEASYLKREKKIILMSDVSFANHLPQLEKILRQRGYKNVYSAKVIHDPSSPLPNRTVPDAVRQDPLELSQWQLFHISDPPQSLLLVLSSRVPTIYIYAISRDVATCSPEVTKASAHLALRRRYALLVSLSSVSIIGILINTLSVKNYLHIVEHVKALIRTAGKKSYTFVVGKVNAAKVANFSEVGGWVVIGCWESSLIESKDFWRPIITPFELELALRKNKDRIWTGEWVSDFQGVLDQSKKQPNPISSQGDPSVSNNRETDLEKDDVDSEPESAPPDFDLRTGSYVSSTKPMLDNMSNIWSDSAQEKSSLIKRIRGDIAVIGGQASPGADFLGSKRTWTGLGSDHKVAYEDSEITSGASLQEGRSGIARGYTNSEGVGRR